MKRLLLPLLAAVLLPHAVEAGKYINLGHYQYENRMKGLKENFMKFIEIKDYEAACSQMSTYNSLLIANFDDLQKVYREADWFGIRKRTKENMELCRDMGY
tara:strand:+ start:58 stop:360 length:303 start_codon:yes stop_codon:yes gene_type:complete